MKLSEAIRLGAMLKRQAFNSGHDGSCALRAACEAIGLPDFAGRLNYHGLTQHWPFLQVYSTCPACTLRDWRLSLIYHLNDRHHWTRERIADWIATVEPPVSTSPGSPTGSPESEAQASVAKASTR